MMSFPYPPLSKMEQVLSILGKVFVLGFFLLFVAWCMVGMMTSTGEFGENCHESSRITNTNDSNKEAP